MKTPESEPTHEHGFSIPSVDGKFIEGDFNPPLDYFEIEHDTDEGEEIVEDEQLSTATNVHSLMQQKEHRQDAHGNLDKPPEAVDLSDKS